jgi:exodeoxyribonuclease V alpha subunit
VITITGISDHLRPEWPITITGMRTVHAVVVLIDEKSQTQALDRIQPGLPMKPGKCGTMTREIQVLCPMNRGGVGARSLNIELQNALNLPGDVRVDRFGWTFCPGDKVMQVENDQPKRPMRFCPGG